MHICASFYLFSTKQTTMIKFYNSLKIITCIFLLGFGVGSASGQTVIYENDFETAGGYTPSVTEFSDGFSDYFIRTDGSDINSNVEFTNIQGSFYFAAQDIDGEVASSTQTLLFDDIDITGFGSLQFSVFLAEDDDGTNQDWDAADFIHFDYDIDNSGVFTNLLHVESDESVQSFNSAPLIDTDFDGIGDGTEITSAFAEFSNAIAGSGSTIDIRVTINLNSGDEDIAFDNLKVTGTPVPTIVVDQSSFDGDFGFVVAGNNSDIRSYSIEAVNLTNDITITPPEGFEVSTASDFTSNVGTSVSPITLTQTGGSVALTTIYVRFSPDVADGSTDSGNISHVSSGATTENIAVTGTEGVDNVAPVFNSAATTSGTLSSNIVVDFSEEITTTDASGFALSIGGTPATITGVTGSGTSQLSFTITEEIAKNSGPVLISYDGSGDAQDLASNALTIFTDEVVTNNTTLNVVADLSAARALGTGESVRISGEVVVSYVTGNSRNQIFIQDSGAGILIDDDLGTIVTSLTAGDGITNLQGTLGAFGGVTQLVPDVDPGATSSTGNTITPLTVTIADFNASVDTYESRLLLIENINYTNADGVLSFTDPTDQYSDVSDGVNTTTFDADGFLNIDYSANTIPYGQHDLIVLGRENNGTPIVTARSAADIQDNYAPLFVSAPATSNITTNSFDVTFQADEPGTYYYVVDQNATAPDAATIISTGTSLAYTDVAVDVTFNVSGLNDNTQYYVHTVLADDETTPNEQATATTTTATTLEIIFDADSDIADPVAQVAAGTVSSIANDAGSAVDVFTFTLSDLGTADGEPTLVNTIVIEKGANNTVADWSSVIAGAVLNDGTTDLTVTGTTINANDISFDLTGNEFSIADGASVEVTLSIYLNTTVVDEEVLEFEIPVTHGFQASVAGSIFVTNLAAAVTSNMQTIDVDATELSVTAPTTAAVNTDFTVSYSAVDANGNIDLANRTMEVSLASGTGTLSSVTGLTQDVFDGTFTWSDLQYDVVEDITLLVDDQGSALTTTTNTITVTSAAVGTLFFSEYIEGSSNNKALEIFNATGSQVDLSEYRILRDNNGTTDATDTLELSVISATLPAEGILVIANPSADASILSIADITSEITFYNGDDALRLMKGSVVIDQIGELGVDPGSSWDVAGGTAVTDGGATAEFTLVRKSDITEGNPTALASFGTDPTDSEWIVLAQDDFSNLGVFDGASSVPPSMIVNTSSFNGNFGFVEFGTDSDVRSYTVEGSNLTDDISITPPTGFEVATTADFSTTVGTNASPLVLTQSAGAVASTEVFVRFVPDAADGTTDSGDIVHSSAGAADKSVAVEGTEGAATITDIATARGLAESTEVTIQGIVTTPDYGFSNGQYYVQDATGGINIFHSGSQGLVNDGDEVEITGVIAIFNDLIEVEPSIVTVLSTGNSLPAATSIAEADLTVDNANQGTRVVISGVTLTDETQWPTEAISAGSNVDVDATVGTATFQITIDRGESFYDGSAVPDQPFTLTGILTRDGTTVQILPFFDGDISTESAGPGITTDVTGFNADFGTVQVNTNSAVSSYTVSANGLTENLTLTIAGEFEVSLTQDFSAQVGNASTPLAISQTQGDVEPTVVYVRFSPTVAGTTTGSITHSSAGVDTQVIDLSGEGTEEEVTAIDPTLIKQSIRLFPNPVNNGSLTVELSETLGQVEVKLMTLTGTTLQSATTLGTTTLKVGGMKSGIYILQLSNDEFTQNYRVILK